MHMFQKSVIEIFVTLRQISKREEMNSKCGGWGKIMLEVMMERISSSVVSLFAMLVSYSAVSEQQ